MKEKYYTPKIEEFCVGFKFEVNVYDHDDPEPVWSELIFEAAHMREVELWVQNKQLRVKYLDAEDIVGCGWEDRNSGGIFNASAIYTYELKSEKMGLGFINYGKPNTYSLSTMGHPTLIQIRATGSNETIFYGTIKNLSTLLKIMEWVGVK